jgi:hypothetical protein
LGLTLFRTTWISPGNGKQHLGIVRLDLKGKDLPETNLLKLGKMTLHLSISIKSLRDVHEVVGDRLKG